MERLIELFPFHLKKRQYKLEQKEPKEVALPFVQVLS